MKTIIVDDDRQAAEDLVAHLGKYGRIEVVGIAANGLDGLTLVNERQPDLLFLDIQLPDISGLDFLDRVGAFTHDQCRVVMFTAYDEYVLPAFRKKAADVLLKPINEEDLDGIIQRLDEDPFCRMETDKGLDAISKDNGKILLYTNTVDFRLIDKRDIGLFQYNNGLRSWEVVVAGSKTPIRLKRNLKSDDLVDLDEQFVQVNQKFIINMNYLIEVIDNLCHFYPPFDTLDYVKVGRFYRRKLIERFCSL